MIFKELTHKITFHPKMEVGVGGKLVFRCGECGWEKETEWDNFAAILNHPRLRKESEMGKAIAGHISSCGAEAEAEG